MAKFDDLDMIMHMQKAPLTDYDLLRFVNKLQEQQTFQNVIVQLRKYPDIQCALLLFCCWYAVLGQGRLSKQDLQQLYNTISAWHERITQVMTKLTEKFVSMTSYNKIKDLIEMEAQSTENSELLMLNDVLIRFSKNTRSPQQKLMDACKNISLYCKLQRIIITPMLSELFYQLIACSFPMIDLLETHNICEQIFFEENELSFKQEKIFLN